MSSDNLPFHVWDFNRNLCMLQMNLLLYYFQKDRNRILLKTKNTHVYTRFCMYTGILCIGNVHTTHGPEQCSITFPRWWLHLEIMTSQFVHHGLFEAQLTIMTSKFRMIILGIQNHNWISILESWLGLTADNHVVPTSLLVLSHIYRTEGTPSIFFLIIALSIYL